MADESVSDEDVRGMVRACRPGWTVRDVERSEYGTDLVCFVTCETPAGSREAVLKATTAEFVDPEIARSEPRFYEFVGAETSIPVPTVFGFVDAHESYPAPFYLVERLPGENFESRAGDLAPAARERAVREAGENLAELHALGTLPRFGRVGVREGALAVLEGEYAATDFREWLRADVEAALDALATGTYYPELADQPDRFVDLVPALREAMAARLASLPEPAPPRYCHWDYRYGNLLLDPETGETQGVLDWANLLAADPVYNLATAEYHMVGAGTPGLREMLRGTYERERDGWTVTDAVTQRLETYALKCRIDAMACLPLWLRDATTAEKDEREREHRAAVADYL